METLLFSMCCGYAATELLRNMQISDSNRDFVVRGVEADVGESIWSDIMKKATPPSPEG